MKFHNRLINGFIVVTLCVSASVFFPTDANARKSGRAGTANGMASTTINTSNKQNVIEAIKAVFNEDGYTFYSETQTQIMFQRAGDRRSELSYGGLATGGVWERVVIGIQEQGSNSFLVGCDAYMLDNPNKEIDFVDTKVMKFFGRQYSRMLSRVKKQAERAISSKSESAI